MPNSAKPLTEDPHTGALSDPVAESLVVRVAMDDAGLARELQAYLLARSKLHVEGAETLSPEQVAYGALWHMMREGPHLIEARRVLLTAIGGLRSPGQRAAVKWAAEYFPDISDADIAGLDIAAPTLSTTPAKGGETDTDISRGCCASNMGEPHVGQCSTTPAGNDELVEQEGEVTVSLGPWNPLYPDCDPLVYVTRGGLTITGGPGKQIDAYLRREGYECDQTRPGIYRLRTAITNASEVGK